MDLPASQTLTFMFTDLEGSTRLRAATRLAGRQQARGDTEGAVATLQSIYAQLTEGFGTADTIAAANLLGSLDH